MKISLYLLAVAISCASLVGCEGKSEKVELLGDGNTESRPLQLNSDDLHRLGIIFLGNMESRPLPDKYAHLSTLADIGSQADIAKHPRWPHLMKIPAENFSKPILIATPLGDYILTESEGLPAGGVVGVAIQLSNNGFIIYSEKDGVDSLDSIGAAFGIARIALKIQPSSLDDAAKVLGARRWVSARVSPLLDQVQPSRPAAQEVERPRGRVTPSSFGLFKGGSNGIQVYVETSPQGTMFGVLNESGINIGLDPQAIVLRGPAGDVRPCTLFRMDAMGFGVPFADVVVSPGDKKLFGLGGCPTQENRGSLQQALVFQGDVIEVQLGSQRFIMKPTSR